VSDTAKRTTSKKGGGGGRRRKRGFVVLWAGYDQAGASSGDGNHRTARSSSACKAIRLASFVTLVTRAATITCAVRERGKEAGADAGSRGLLKEEDPRPRICSASLAQSREECSRRSSSARGCWERRRWSTPDGLANWRESRAVEPGERSVPVICKTDVGGRGEAKPSTYSTNAIDGLASSLPTTSPRSASVDTYTNRFASIGTT